MTERTPDEVKLDALAERLRIAGVHYDAERSAGVEGPDFEPLADEYTDALTAWRDEAKRQHASTPPVPLATYNGMPPLSGPHESTHKRFPPLMSCHEFEQARARTATTYLWWFACVIATVVGTVLVVAFLLYAAGA